MKSRTRAEQIGYVAASIISCFPATNAIASPKPVLMHFESYSCDQTGANQKQYDDSKVIQRVNSAGSVSTNYLAELEAIIPKVLCGSLVVAGTILAQKGKRKIGATLIAWGVISFLGSPIYLGILNWAIATAREASPN